MQGLNLRLLLLLPGLLLVQGCNHPHEKPDEVIGTYKPTEATLQLMAYYMGYLPKSPPRIELGSNFSITIHNMPDAWPTTYGGSKESSNYFSGHGRWSFSGATPEVSLLSLNLEEIHYSPVTPANAPPDLIAINLMELCGRNPRFVLRFIIGDPDNHGGFEFIRQPGTNEPGRIK